MKLIHALNAALALTPLMIGSAAAQRPKVVAERPPVTTAASNAMMPFGQMKSITGRRAVATGSNKAIVFDIPAELAGKVGPSQLVLVNMTRTIASFAAFPLVIPFGKDCVGEGAGKGCFRMETSEARVSYNGLTTGKTKTISEDVISGFTGATWVQLHDRNGNPLAIRRAGCWGVNMRSGRTEVWSVQFPADTAGMASRATVWHVQSPCDRDRWDAVLEKAKKAAEVYAAYKQSPARDTTVSTTQPTVR